MLAEPSWPPGPNRPGYHVTAMSISLPPALHVVLVHPEIPWNTGNIGRTCLATGTRLHLVRPLGFSLAGKEISRAGLDYWQKAHPTVWNDWRDLEAALPGLGEVFLFSSEGRRDFWAVRYPQRSVLVFGSESSGLPSDIRRRFAQQTVRIPTTESDVRSLNLSTVVALALYEVLRQRSRHSAIRDEGSR